MRRWLAPFTALAIVTLLTGIVPAAGAGAATAQVTGQLFSKDKSALSPAAVAMISIVDQQASPEAGAVVASQRVDGAQLPLQFAVTYDPARIDPTHSYALFASVVDGGRTLQSIEPVPVITGGPTSGLGVELFPISSAATGAVKGTLVRTDKSALSSSAAAFAALIRQDTGTLVARQAIATITTEPIAFSIAYDPGIIDPKVTYVVRGGLVDGARSWTSPTPVAAIVNGTVAPSVTVSLVPATGGTTPTPAPTATPKPTAAPTATPKPTAAPTATPKPTAAPTAAPTSAPTAAPTATPTAAPTAAPTATPTTAPTPTPTPTATPAPDSGTISGTLTYEEEHVLTADARAAVFLVEGTAGPKAGTIIASVSIKDPGPQPVAFSLAYPMSAVTAGGTYRLYAGIVDGELAWVTPIGVDVKVPQTPIEGVVLPLAYRPDLLKGAVTGTINGLGLEPNRSPDSYGTALIVRVDTGETIGFQLIEPLDTAPVAFSAPYDPSALDPNADYVVRGSIWDGTTLWTTAVGTPVITKGNPKSGVTLTVTEAVTPGASPSPAATAAPTPAASAAPEQPAGGDSGSGFLPILIVVVLVAAGGGIAYMVLRNRR